MVELYLVALSGHTAAGAISMGLILEWRGVCFSAQEEVIQMAQAKAEKVAHADPVKVDSKHYT